MREQDFINVIEQVVGKEYLGDDCAYLKELGLVITQDSLVENIHFKRDWYSPFELGYKSAAVNLSDVLASGAEPKFFTVALSLTNDIMSDWVEEFYKGFKSAIGSAKIVGGDITGSKDDIMISVTAMGSDNGRKISSRANAKEDFVIITRGEHGSSAKGLEELNCGKNNSEFINSHKMPELEWGFSKQISTLADEDYAMMDSSDGLADALFKIAEASGVKIVVDYDKIPHAKEVEPKKVLFGGEDYKLVAAVPKNLAEKIEGASIIGFVENFDGIRLEVAGKQYSSYDEMRTYNHFGEDNE